MLRQQPGPGVSTRLSECLRSTFTPSNELFNIWSHAIGLVIVLFLAFYLYPSSDHFNLSTKTLSVGTWNIKLTFDDGAVERTRISLR